MQRGIDFEMPLEKIIERIISEAQEEAKQIRKEAKDKAKEIIGEGKKEALQRREEILAAAKNRAENNKRGIISQARLESRNSILKIKREILDTVFKQALEELLSLSSSRYRALLKNLLLKTEKIGRAKIISSPSSRKYFDSRFISEVNEALKKEGKETRLELATETRPLPRGFILQANGIEINYSFPVLLESVREKLEPEVFKIIFP